ncbi:MAG: pyridoxal phosphate-dependent decarboxylase family protein, partial [Candidatus Planktophila sp.]
MHEFTPEIEKVAQEILEYSLTRLKDNPPLDGPMSEAELFSIVGNTITESGLGGSEALQLFTQTLAPACISTDHPRYLAFIPSAPSELANLFDLVVGASALYGGSWLEGAGAVFAENQTLRWLSDLAGLPDTAGGVFVQGGTIGNLSALVAARKEARRLHPEVKRWAVACSSEAHSSIQSATEVMDVDLIKVPVQTDGIMRGEDVKVAIDTYRAQYADRDICAIVATAGTTNLGIIDDLPTVGVVANRHKIWFHVDGAYGLAGLANEETRKLFAGVERADSFIVDPHKWLFAPYDVCALIYRNAVIGREAHTQHAGYLDALTDSEEFNPSDYAIQLTRRTRGLPLWFSLAAHGTKAYSDAVAKTMETARMAAAAVKVHPNLELLREPTLSIIAFTRKGWTMADYKSWSDKLLADQIGFVTPSTHKGEPILRFAIVNPWTQ